MPTRTTARYDVEPSRPIDIWECDEPPRDAIYQVTSSEWNDDYSARIIYEWKLVAIVPPSQMSEI